MMDTTLASIFAGVYDGHAESLTLIQLSLKQRDRACPLLAGGCRALLAQQRASCLARSAQQSTRPDPQGPLWATVERLLRERRHSLEQIAGLRQARKSRQAPGVG
ncbi:MAG: hypothetical protein VB142_07350 [Burkholderia sp.]